MDPDRLVPVGRVGRPHGLDGSFVVEEASDDDRRWRAGATLLVDGERATIELVRRVGRGKPAIKLDRQVVRGTTLSVRVADLPPPGPDSFYEFQLVGLRVEEDGGRPLGTVRGIQPGLANDNLELEGGTLVPMIEDAIVEIDIEAGRVVVVRGFLA